MTAPSDTNFASNSARTCWTATVPRSRSPGGGPCRRRGRTRRRRDRRRALIVPEQDVQRAASSADRPAASGRGPEDRGRRHTRSQPRCCSRGCRSSRHREEIQGREESASLGIMLHGSPSSVDPPDGAGEPAHPTGELESQRRRRGRQVTRLSSSTAAQKQTCVEHVAKSFRDRNEVRSRLPRYEGAVRPRPGERDVHCRG